MKLRYVNGHLSGGDFARIECHEDDLRTLYEAIEVVTACLEGSDESSVVVPIEAMGVLQDFARILHGIAHEGGATSG